MGNGPRQEMNLKNFKRQQIKQKYSFPLSALGARGQEQAGAAEKGHDQR